MAQQGATDRQLIDLPGPRNERELVVIEHGRGAAHLGEQLRQGIELLSGDTRQILRDLEYGNNVGAITELGRLRDRWANRMFPAATERVDADTIDGYLTAATNLTIHAGDILRDRAAADSRRLHSFFGPLSVGMRRMHAGIAAADPGMEDLPLLVATFANLYDVAQLYTRTLESRNRVPDGFFERMKNAGDAVKALSNTKMIDADAVSAALGPGVTLLTGLPGYNLALDLPDEEKTHGRARRDRAAEARVPLAALLRPHLAADVDADVVARYVVAEHPGPYVDPFVALQAVRSLSGGMTPGASFEDVLNALASKRSAAGRKEGLADEKRTAELLLQGLSRARSSASAGPDAAVAADHKPTPIGPRNIYTPNLPYAIDADVFWLGLDAYRKEFFADLTALTELLGDTEAVKAAITDKWTRTITPTLVTGFVDEVGERLVHAEIAAQQLAGVHLRMADPKSGVEQAPGAAFSRIGEEIDKVHTTLNGLRGRADELAAMSFDVLNDARLDAALGELAGSVRWAEPLWGGQDPRPEVPFADTPMARTGAKLAEDFGDKKQRADHKITDPHRLARYFGGVAQERHRPLPTDPEGVRYELTRRRMLAMDGVNIMLHAAMLHPEAVPQVARRINALVDDMAELTLRQLENPEEYDREALRKAWSAVHRHVDQATADPDPADSEPDSVAGLDSEPESKTTTKARPASSSWRLAYGRRVEYATGLVYRPWQRKPVKDDRAAPVETRYLPESHEGPSPSEGAEYRTGGDARRDFPTTDKVTAAPVPQPEGRRETADGPGSLRWRGLAQGGPAERRRPPKRSA
ncbi:MAG TPA: hypothetical protein VHU91_02075 [Mycobacteriales bacterium]|jgi:hypothetical protein|nr:hypothetical protein [Mycobacteriales bacterium]